MDFDHIVGFFGNINDTFVSLRYIYLNVSVPILNKTFLTNDNFYNLN